MEVNASHGLGLKKEEEARLRWILMPSEGMRTFSEDPERSHDRVEDIKWGSCSPQGPFSSSQK